MDFIMEDIEPVINEDEDLDYDWTNEKSKELQEDNEDTSENDSGSSISSEMEEDDVQHQEMKEESVWADDNHHNENLESLNEDTTQNRASVKRDYSPSFTGLGKCKCGCGSFVGCGSICEACGHSYKAHGPY